MKPTSCLKKISGDNQDHNLAHKETPTMLEELSTHQAAAVLGLTVRTVQHHITRGTIPARKHGRDWFITREAVEAARLHRPKPGRPQGSKNIKRCAVTK